MVSQFKKMDMHVHTRFSTEGPDYGVVKVMVNMAGDPADLYQKAKNLGMDFVTFTDHNTIDGCLYLLEKMPHIDDFIISEEITTHDPEYKFVIHINAYDITRLQHRRIMNVKKSFPKLIHYLKGQNILYSYNHPYWHRHLDYIITIPKPIQRVYEMAKNFSVLEGINSFRLPKQNMMAQDMAKTLGLSTIAGSDAHGGSIGRAYTLTKSNNIKEFLGEVRVGRTQMVGTGYSLRAIYQECMNVFYANITKIREEYPSKKVKLLTNFINPIVKFGVRRQVRKNENIQRRIVRDMKKS